MIYRMNSTWILVRIWWRRMVYSLNAILFGMTLWIMLLPAYFLRHPLCLCLPYLLLPSLRYYIDIVHLTNLTELCKCREECREREREQLYQRFFFVYNNFAIGCMLVVFALNFAIERLETLILQDLNSTFPTYIIGKVIPGNIWQNRLSVIPNQKLPVFICWPQS